MRYWRLAAGLDGTREDVRLIHDQVHAAFAGDGGPVPRILGIAACQTDADEFVYETYLELAPGVPMSTTFGSPDDIEGTDFPVELASDAAAEATISIRAHLAIGIERLADMLHDLRTRTRMILAGGAGDGGGPRLIDVRLTAAPWSRPDEISVALRLEGIDDKLLPIVEELRIGDLATFDDVVGRWAASMEIRYAARRAFAREGASGSIDLLTINAISSITDMGAWIRDLSTPGWPPYPDYITIFAKAGAVRSHGYDLFSPLRWNRDSVQYPIALPATVLVACTGRPITDLIQHEMISDEMTIVDASCSFDGGEPTLSVRIDQPRLLFCTGSGRVWQREGPVVG